MSDQSIQSQIDAMVSASVARAVNPAVSGSNISGDSAGTLEVTSDGNGHTSVVRHSDPTAPPGRIPDAGINTQWEAQRLFDTLTGIKAKLDAFTFDPMTGAKVFTLEAGSPERAKMEAHYASQKKLAAYQLTIYQRLDAQRAADAKEAEFNRLREAYVAGNPAKAKLLDEAIERKRAEMVANQIIQHDIERASRGR